MNTINYSSNGLRQFQSDVRFAGIDGKSQTITVIDFGFKLDHPGFGPDYNGDGVGDKIVRRDLDFNSWGNGDANDGHPHGTLTSGVATSTAKGAKILPIQVGLGMQHVVRGIEYSTAMAEKYNIKVISISLSDSRNTLNPLPDALTKPFYTAVSNAEKAGITVVTSAGNNYSWYKQPGASGLAQLSNVIGVSGVQSNAVTDGTGLYPNSQRSPSTIGAPGYGVTTFSTNGGYQISAGTSIAAPFIGGSVSLLQGVAERYLGRALRPPEVKSLLSQTATPLPGTPGQTQINVYNAADLLHRIGTGKAPDSLSKTPLTNPAHTFSTAPTRWTQTYWGTNQQDVLTGRSTTRNTFKGGGGSDLLVGGTGVNVFEYGFSTDGGVSKSGDTILNFTPGKDKIDIKNLLRQAKYQGINPLNDKVISLGITNGTDTLISFDRDGSGPLQPQVLATVSNVLPCLMGNVSNFIFS
jgi:hypothetical protein